MSDNFKLTEAYFTLVDEEGNVVETYNYMDMAKEAGDIVTLTLPSSDKKQSLRYYAADAAGNSIVTLEDENTATGFTISTNAGHFVTQMIRKQSPQQLQQQRL